MPDVATPAALAASGAIYGSALAIGVPEPLALPVALLAAVGAAQKIINRGGATNKIGLNSGDSA